MTCTEFQQILPDILEVEAEGEHAAHLKSCAVCTDLVSDLRAICAGARLLGGADDPSPRVWANLQRALEAEGLIHAPQQAGGVVVPVRKSWLSPVWLAPLAAALVLATGIILRERVVPPPSETAGHTQASPSGSVSGVHPAANAADADDAQLLAQISPAMRATYEDNLRNVNAFIQDAQSSLDQDPNDDEARRFLMDAYAQKAMVYELAMDRSMQ
ncbi:MAG TPA: hypothetical protein VGF08_11610 [Terriglobales bacterium]|jgi:hypothetical protein